MSEQDDIVEQAMNMVDDKMENNSVGPAIIDTAVVSSYLSFPLWAHDLGLWAQFILMVSGSALVIWRCAIGIRDAIHRMRVKRSQRHAHQRPRDEAGKFTARHPHK